jgi:hypothetical protein
MDSLRSRFLKWAVPVLTAAAAYFWYRCHKINASELKQSDPGGDVEEMRENCKNNVALSDGLIVLKLTQIFTIHSRYTGRYR